MSRKGRIKEKTLGQQCPHGIVVLLEVYALSPER